LKKMKLEITHMRTKSTSPSTASSSGTWLSHWAQWSCQLPLGKPEKTTAPSSYHAILGRLAIAKFMAVPHYTYLVLKMPSPAGVLSLQGDLKISFDCDRSCGTRSHQSSTQRHDGDLCCVKDACTK
jgi:hypothetical protein